MVTGWRGRGYGGLLGLQLPLLFSRGDERAGQRGGAGHPPQKNHEVRYVEPAVINAHPDLEAIVRREEVCIARQVDGSRTVCAVMLRCVQDRLDPPLALRLGFYGGGGHQAQLERRRELVAIPCVDRRERVLRPPLMPS